MQTTLTRRTYPSTRAIAVTLAALAASVLLRHVPLPGLNLSHAALDQPGTISRLSVGALGIAPWLTAAMMIEALALLWPAIHRWSFIRNGHVAPTALVVTALALLIALAQGYGVATALASMGDLLVENSTINRLAIQVTLAAGAALMILLAIIIDRYGFGHGFWIFVAAAFLPDILSQVMIQYEMTRFGGVSVASLITTLMVSIAIVLGTIAILKARHMAGFRNPSPILWTPLVAQFLFGLVLSVTAMAIGLDATWSLIKTKSGILKVIVDALIMLAVLALYTRREGSWPLFLPTALLLLVATTAADVLLLNFGPSLAIGGHHLVLMAAVLYMVAGQEWPLVKASTSPTRPDMPS